MFLCDDIKVMVTFKYTEILHIGMNIKTNSVLCFNNDKTKYGVSKMINENVFNAVKLSKQADGFFKPMAMRIKRIGFDTFEILDLQSNEIGIKTGLKIGIPTKQDLVELKASCDRMKSLKKTNLMKMVNHK